MSLDVSTDTKADRTQSGRARKRTNLATERTKFANERTFMAYARTSFSMMVVGLTMMEFFDQERYRVIAIALVPLGFAVGIFGLVRFLIKRKVINAHSLDSYERDGD